MNEIFRTTKCFGVNGQGKCKGSFPKGLLLWIQKNGWWGKSRVYLCAGMVDDSESIRIDIRPEVNPTLCEDARHTSLKDLSADWVMIDPPYTKELASELYGTENYFRGINVFTKEANRICKPGGLILTLSYEIPKRIPGCDFIAVCGIYTVPFCGFMRCFTVSKRRKLKL